MARYPSLDDDPSGLAHLPSIVSLLLFVPKFLLESSEDFLGIGLRPLSQILSVKDCRPHPLPLQTFSPFRRNRSSSLSRSSGQLRRGFTYGSRSYRGRCIRSSPGQYTISQVHLNSHALSVICLYVSQLIVCACTSTSLKWPAIRV